MQLSYQLKMLYAIWLWLLLLFWMDGIPRLSIIDDKGSVCVCFLFIIINICHTFWREMQKQCQYAHVHLDGCSMN